MNRGDRVQLGVMVHEDLRHKLNVGTYLGTYDASVEVRPQVRQENRINFTGQIRDGDAVVLFDSGDLCLVEPKWLELSGRAQIAVVGDNGIMLMDGRHFSYTELAGLLKELWSIPMPGLPDYIQEHIQQHFAEASRLLLCALDIPKWVK